MTMAIFLSRLRRHLGWATLGTVASLMTVLAAIGLFALAGWFVAAAGAVEGDPTRAGAVALAIVVLGISVQASVGIRVLALIRMIGRYVERVATHEATFGVLADLRLWFFRAVIPLAPARLGDARSGDLLARAVGDVDTLDGLYIRVLLPSAVALVAVAVTLAGLGVVLGPVALSTAICAILAGLVIPALAQAAGRGPGARITRNMAGLRTEMVEMLQGMEALKVYGAEAGRISAVADLDQRLAADQNRMVRTAAIASGISGMISQGAFVLAVILGLHAVQAGTADITLVAMAALAVLALFEAVTPLGAAYQQWGRIRDAADRLMEIAQRTPAVVDIGDAGREPGHNDLALDQVHFAYGEPEARRALDSVSLQVRSGERVAILGQSGSGKTSILSLFMRVWDPEAGRVLLGGTDIRSIRLAALRARIGWLGQRTEMFAGTIRDNLLIARPDAGEDEISRAIGVAGLDAFLAELPEGLDTYVGEGGASVSGGQARRIALARVVLKDAPILFLDEPTEGLDAATEADVMRALSVFMQGRTVLMVTHRLEGIGLMDRIVVMEGGRIAEEGSPEVLRRAGGRYARLLAYVEDRRGDEA